MTIDNRLYDILTELGTQEQFDLITGLIQYLELLKSDSVEALINGCIADYEIHKYATVLHLQVGLVNLAKEYLEKLEITYNDNLNDEDILKIIIAYAKLLHINLDDLKILNENIVDIEDNLNLLDGLLKVFDFDIEDLQFKIINVGDKLMDLYLKELEKLNIDSKIVEEIKTNSKRFLTLFKPTGLLELTNPIELYTHSISDNVEFFKNDIRLFEIPNVINLLYVLICSKDSYEDPKTYYYENIEASINPMLVERINEQVEKRFKELLND